MSERRILRVACLQALADNEKGVTARRRLAPADRSLWVLLTPDVFATRQACPIPVKIYAPASVAPGASGLPSSMSLRWSPGNGCKAVPDRFVTAPKTASVAAL